MKDLNEGERLANACYPPVQALKDSMSLRILLFKKVTKRSEK
jgi:hypothetical protein